MVKILALLCLCAVPLFAQAKQPTARALLTFTPGFLTAQKIATYGLGGELELYTKGKLSLRGDGYALVGKSERAGLKQSYQGLLGIVYNFGSLTGLIPFVGFQPGFGLSQMESPTYAALRVVPVFSPFVGVHYFAETLFHFTLCVRYVYGELHYPTVGAVPLSELRLAFGLGIYL